MRQLPLLLVAVASFAGVPAFAQADPAPPAPATCQSDPECGDGKICADITCSSCGPDCTVCEGVCAPAPQPATCETSPECGDGFFCEIPPCVPCGPDETDCPACLGVCAPLPQTTCSDDGGCADDEYCALPDCTGVCNPDDPTCEPADCGGEGVCLPRGEPVGDCDGDDDCVDGETCITRTFEICSGSVSPDCPPDDANCRPNEGAVPPPECESEVVRFCGPVWQAPCEVDEDCGPGFSCLAAELCGCTSSSDGGDAGCDCIGTAERSCVLNETPCSDDNDCDDGMVCGNAADVAPCAISEDGSGDCTARSSEGVCAPEGYVGASRALSVEDVTDGSPDDGDDAGFTLHCGAAPGRGLLPVLALLFVLAGRRRRR